MFFLLRVVLVIGLIFYLSPARTPGSGRTPPDLRNLPSVERAATGLSERLDELSRAWNALPEPMRQKALDAMSDELRRRLNAGRSPEDTGKHR